MLKGVKEGLESESAGERVCSPSKEPLGLTLVQSSVPHSWYPKRDLEVTPKNYLK